MSHIIEIELLINDLAALKAAVAADPRLEWREKKTYNWYGRRVGNEPLPGGLSVSDLGKCDFAIGVKGKPGAYEVGVIKKKDGSGYTLMGDFYCGGFGLCEVVGEKLPGSTNHDDKQGHNFYKLANSYAAQVSAKAMKKKGFKVQIKPQPNGNYEVVCKK